MLALTPRLIQGPFLDPKPRRRSLILQGPSKLGKTEWALSLGTCVHFRGMVDFKNPAVKQHLLQQTAGFIIFDDFDSQAWIKGHYKDWLGCQYNITATDKYLSKITFRGGVPAIFLTNYFDDTGYDRHWLSCNVDFISINTPLF